MTIDLSHLNELLGKAADNAKLIVAAVNNLLPHLIEQNEEQARRIQRLSGVLHQYRNDMLYPPAADSRDRRVAMIDAALAGMVD